jgi:phenylacetaldehyde dehydrogenase
MAATVTEAAPDVLRGGSRQMLIGADWVDAASGETFDTLNPATEEVLAKVPFGGTEDVDRAVRAARAAFADDSPWRQMSPSERGRILHRVGDLIYEHGEELAILDSLDNGKPVAMARIIDVPASADMFHYMSGWPTKIEGNTIPWSNQPPDRLLAFTLREPVGVVAQIIPWNFPLIMAATKLAPALACGCTIILKPAEQTPLSALRLGELCLEAGIPEGVVNIVTGDGTAGAALAAHPDVDKVAFTGSTEVGRLIVKAAAGNLKKVTLELGGKSPNIVFADADLERAIPGSAMAIFFNAGEVCAAGSRLYVEQPIFDEFVSGLSEEAKKIKLGSGLEPDTTMGPLVSSEQLERVTGYIESGISDGANVAIGGARVGEKGYFVEPTILTATSPTMKVESEEIFGPVVAAIPFSDPAELASTANGTTYGLAAGVFTNDVRKAYTTARRLRAGTVWINTWHMLNSAVPFGGYKQSGWGREMGHDALEGYLETKSVITDLS